MSRPKIKTALVSVFILIGIIVAGFSVYSVDRLKATNGFVNNIANDWMPSVALASRMQQDFSDIRLAYRDHIMALDDSGMNAADARVKRGISDLYETTSQFEAIYTYQRELDLAKQVRGELAEYSSLGVKLMTMSVNDNDQGAKVLLATEMKPLADKIALSIDELIEINTTGAEKTFAASQEVFGTTLIMTFVAIGVCAVVLLTSIWFALGGIARPIQTITGAMTKLAAGDTQAAVPYAGRADEIGEMAGAVEVFRQAALSNKRLEEEAEAARSQSEADRIRLTAEAEAAAQTRLREATSGLAAGLRRLAAGDLGFQLNEPFAPDFEALRQDLNGAVRQLAETLRAVAHSTTQIDSGTREISQSTDDLSKRTEQQAASLEETAAALDQITVNVSNSSKRAEEARSVAVQANASAVHSGTVVASAVDAMQKIEQSSNQVSSIIVVIDEIAFQTNLLALNAGVEAARAGEAGKGFAVVAQEVRELAQRSAKAAKEIKELIRNSSIEVQSGVKLVSETGDALKTIESLIVAVNQHMDAIATSTKEQSVGLAEVNTAVNQMDQVTQQNAAMVEESNAAGAALAGEAGRLRELISQFQFGNGHSQSIAGTHASTPHRSVTSISGKPVARVA